MRLFSALPHVDSTQEEVQSQEKAGLFPSEKNSKRYSKMKTTAEPGWEVLTTHPRRSRSPLSDVGSELSPATSKGGGSARVTSALPALPQH